MTCVMTVEAESHVDPCKPNTNGVDELLNSRTLTPAVADLQPPDGGGEGRGYFLVVGYRGCAMSLDGDALPPHDWLALPL